LALYLDELGLQMANGSRKPGAFLPVLWPHIELVSGLGSKPYSTFGDPHFSSDVSSVFRSYVAQCETGPPPWEEHLGEVYVMDYSSPWLTRAMGVLGLYKHKIRQDACVSAVYSKISELAVAVFPAFALALEETVQTTIGSSSNTSTLIREGASLQAAVLPAALTLSMSTSMPGEAYPTTLFTWSVATEGAGHPAVAALDDDAGRPISPAILVPLHIYRSGLWQFVQPYISGMSLCPYTGLLEVGKHASYYAQQSTTELNKMAETLRFVSCLGGRLYSKVLAYEYERETFFEWIHAPPTLLGGLGPLEQSQAAYRAPTLLLVSTCSDMRSTVRLTTYDPPSRGVIAAAIGHETRTTSGKPRLRRKFRAC